MASTGITDTLHDFFKPAGATALADQLERQIGRADAADERARGFKFNIRPAFGGTLQKSFCFRGRCPYIRFQKSRGFNRATMVPP